jgi:glyoxylase-like metal-dependent hydrolase (beta-lactamase superfamily II)
MDVLADNQELKIERLELGKWNTNSYILICKVTGKSGLIDIPSGAPTILKHLKDTTLECMFLTHNHRDHTGGLRTLRANILAPLAINEFDNQKILPVRPDMALSDKDCVIIGKLRVEVIYTPGHTPGSQMVYVRRADGVEFLFVGDVAWQMRNIERVREKARVVKWMAGEDRDTVREELAGLNQLHAAAPEVHMMPGHDAAVIDSFVKDGLLVRGF